MADIAGSPAGASIVKWDPLSQGQFWVVHFSQTFLRPKDKRLLTEVGVNIFSHDYCVNNSIYGNFIVEEAEICAGVPDRNGDGLTDGGKDACQGQETQALSI